MKKTIKVLLILFGILAVIAAAYNIQYRNTAPKYGNTLPKEDRYKYPADYPQNYFDCIKNGGKMLETDGTFSRCEYKDKWYEYEG